MWVGLATQVKSAPFAGTWFGNHQRLPQSTFTEKVCRYRSPAGGDRGETPAAAPGVGQEKQQLLYLADLGKITRKKEKSFSARWMKYFGKMSEVQRMCKTVQGATSTLVSRFFR